MACREPGGAVLHVALPGGIFKVQAMAKTKRYRITLLVTVEEISAEPGETRPLVEELQTRPWYPPEGERRRRRQRPRGERPDNERAE